MSKVERWGWIDRWSFSGKGFKVSEDRTREPFLFQGSGFLRAWGGSPSTRGLHLYNKFRSAWLEG